MVKRTNYNQKNKTTIQKFSGENDYFKNKVFIQNLNQQMIVNLDNVGSNHE
ncbi:MAG: hypothetical protein HC854_04900 [Flavobacterium sp.]|nr:hypothetical protein [Flavobacterium sp.]